MKLKLVLILFALICTCEIAGQEEIITVKNDMTFDEIKSGISGHKDKDIDIVRFKMDGKDLYWVILYRVENGKLNDFKDFGFGSTNDYDKATYEWIDDLTLKFKVFNSTSGQSESFIQTGYGSKASELKRVEIR